MNTETENPTTADNPEQGGKKRRIPKKAWGYTATAVAGILIGTAAGTTETVEVEKPVEVVKEVEVEVASDMCRDFSGSADRLIEIYSEALVLGGESVGAIGGLDFATVEANTKKMQDLKSERLDPELMSYYVFQAGCLNP